MGVNDIALLRLVRPARRKQNIDVVCIGRPKELLPEGLTDCVVTGWGRRSESAAELSEPSLGRDTAFRTRRCAQVLRVKTPVTGTVGDPWFVRVRANGTRWASSALGLAVEELEFPESTRWCQLSSLGWRGRSSGTEGEGAASWCWSTCGPAV